MQFSVTIPQIFYDLIARIVPGSLFLIALTYELSGTGITSPLLTNLSSDVLLIILFVLACGIMSYLMGWVLHAFSFLSAEADIKKAHESNLASQKIRFSLREMYIMIRMKNEAAGFRILKLRAEARMLQSSRTGMFYISWIALGLVLLNSLVAAEK